MTTSPAEQAAMARALALAVTFGIGTLLGTSGVV